MWGPSSFLATSANCLPLPAAVSSAVPGASCFCDVSHWPDIVFLLWLAMAQAEELLVAHPAWTSHQTWANGQGREEENRFGRGGAVCFEVRFAVQHAADGEREWGVHSIGRECEGGLRCHGDVVCEG